MNISVVIGILKSFINWNVFHSESFVVRKPDWLAWAEQRLKMLENAWCMCAEDIAFGVASEYTWGRGYISWEIKKRTYSKFKMLLAGRIIGKKTFDCASFTFNLTGKQEFSTLLKKVCTSLSWFNWMNGLV
jgi:hypothetical protein